MKPVRPDPTFGKNLHYLRTSRDLSMDALCRAYNTKYAAKLNKSTLSRYENGLQQPLFSTVQNLADFFDVTTDTLLQSLTTRELADFEKGAPMKATPKEEPCVVISLQRIPILGEIPAGTPILAQENIIGYEESTLQNFEEYFYLRVRGDSMVGAGIPDGGLVLIHSQPVAENGDIVACRVNGDEATLKRFRRQGDNILLLPENPKYNPVVIPTQDFDAGFAEILGVAKEVKFSL